MPLLLDLFCAFFRIGLFTFGGGYAMLPLLQREIVEKKKWATEEEMLDYFAVGQCTPGVIAVNTATFVGFKEKKLSGAIFATLGIVSPSLVIITVIAALLSNFAHIAAVQNAFAGIRVAVCVLIFNSIVKLWKKSVVDKLTFAVFLAVFIGSVLLSHVSPVVFIVAAAVLGIDINGLLAGAAYMDNVCRYPSPAKNPALMCAVLQVAAMEQGKNVGVMMPYSDNLKYLADWYCQLWAESLGKNVTLDGTPCNVGQTPVKSLGVTDQHSQVQLYTEGPYDKVVTFLSLKKYACSMPIPHGCENIPDVAFLGGHTMEELIQAENEATAYALTKAGRMNYTLWLPELNAFTLGQLLFLFELQTAYAGAMLNIDTFNQPGVEEGKKATFALLGKAGYSAKKAELDAQPAKDPKYII